MTRRDWDDTRRDFCRMVAREGVRNAAKMVPANYVTVYRIISGETKSPTLPMRAAIERFVEERRNDDVDK